MPEQPVQLRHARTAEAARIAALVNHAYGRTDEPAGWTSEAEIIAGPRIQPDGIVELVEATGSTLLTATIGGDVVGCVHLEEGEHTGDVELGLLSVDPELQAGGVGSDFLARAEAYAQEELGATRIVLHVVSVRERLIAWYEARGYQRTGEQEAFEPFGGQRFLQGPLTFDVLVKDVV